jgi:DNA-binding LacI/PurR family transcriptional regulator
VAAAEQLGYRANPQAQALRRGAPRPTASWCAMILAQLTTSDATARPAGSRVTLAIRPDPVLVSADAPAVSER